MQYVLLFLAFLALATAAYAQEDDGFPDTTFGAPLTAPYSDGSTLFASFKTPPLSMPSRDDDEDDGQTVTRETIRGFSSSLRFRSRTSSPSPDTGSDFFHDDDDELYSEDNDTNSFDDDDNSISMAPASQVLSIFAALLLPIVTLYAF